LCRCAGIGVIYDLSIKQVILNHKSNVAYQNQNRKSLIFDFFFDSKQFLIKITNDLSQH